MEVEHSVPRRRRNDHLNNLYAACVSCNRSKGSLDKIRPRKERLHKRATVEKQEDEQCVDRRAVGALATLFRSATPAVAAAVFGVRLWGRDWP